MNNLVIIPYIHHEKYGKDALIRLSWCFLHGKIESEYGEIPMVIKESIKEFINPKKPSIKGIPDGIYNCTVEGKECTFFYWYGEIAGQKNSYQHGLIVYNDDKKAYKDALKKYNRKEDWI